MRCWLEPGCLEGQVMCWRSRDSAVMGGGKGAGRSRVAQQNGLEGQVLAVKRLCICRRQVQTSGYILVMRQQ